MSADGDGMYGGNAELLYRNFTDKVSREGSFLEADLQETEKKALGAHLIGPKLVFDLGAGNGRALPYLVETYSCKVIAVDFEPRMIEMAKKRGDNPRITFIHGDFVELLPTLDDPDAILCLGTVFCSLQDDRKRADFIRLSHDKMAKKHGLLYLGYRSVSQARDIENIVCEEKTDDGSIIVFEEPVTGEMVRGSQYYPDEGVLKRKLALAGYRELASYGLERGKLSRTLLVLRADG